MKWLTTCFKRKFRLILFQSPLRSKLFVAVNCVWSANYLDVLYTILLQKTSIILCIQLNITSTNFLLAVKVIGAFCCVIDPRSTHGWHLPPTRGVAPGKDGGGGDFGEVWSFVRQNSFIPPPYEISWKLIGRFHVAERLFSNRSQMASKWVKNKIVAQKDQENVSLMFFPHF